MLMRFAHFWTILRSQQNDMLSYMKLILEFLVFLIVKLFESAKKKKTIIKSSLMTGLFGDPVKRKGVVADKVGKE